MGVRGSAHRSIFAVVGLLLALLAWPVAAQSYRCTNGSGTVLSDRPCRTEKLGAYGPVPERPSYSPQNTPFPNRAPDFLPYLGSQCAQMNDAIRTGPSRGVQGPALADLMQDYRKRCGEDEQLAQQRLSQHTARDKDARQQEQARQQAERSRTALTSEQCHENLRILAAKRKRVDSMTPGERGDLDLFEANYKARCKPG